MNSSDLHKIWVFQSSCQFSDFQLNWIEFKLQNFLSQWQTHGSNLVGKYEIIENQFIKIKVDDSINSASGCSIDSMTKIIKEIDQEFSLQLLNRTLIAYNEDLEIKILPLNEFKSKIKSLNPATIIYNLSVTNENEFNDSFKQKLNDSWMKVYL